LAGFTQKEVDAFENMFPQENGPFKFHKKEELLRSFIQALRGPNPAVQPP
jgi:hypothetical protein